MPVDDARKLKIRKPKLFYVPLALEILIALVPFLVLGGWYIDSMLTELKTYQSGLGWITMVELLEKEYGRFDEWMKDDDLETIDLAVEYRDDLLPAKKVDALEGGMVVEIGDKDEIGIQYLFYGKDGSLMELDVVQKTLSAVPTDSQYYYYATSALKKKKPQESLMRTLYNLGGQNYYGSFVPLRPSKPVCYGKTVLSDGSAGDCILVSGRLCKDLNIKSIGARGAELQFFTLLPLVVLLGASYVALYLSKKNLKLLEDFILAFGNEDADIPDFDSGIVKKENLPEIRNLFESFQLMFLSLRKYQKSISSIRSAYEPLLPAAFLALFNRKDIRDIKPGDQAYVKGRVLSVRLTSLPGTGQEIVWERNVLYKQILQILESMGMIVTELENERITAIRLLRNDENRVIIPENKLYAFRSVCERNRESVVSVTDTEGEFCYTVTGAPKHMAIRMEQISDQLMEPEIPEVPEYAVVQNESEYAEPEEALEYAEPEESPEYSETMDVPDEELAETEADVTDVLEEEIVEADDTQAEAMEAEVKEKA